MQWVPVSTECLATKMNPISFKDRPKNRNRLKADTLKATIIYALKDRA